MDKFRELINRIEDIVKSLDEQIKLKNEAYTEEINENQTNIYRKQEIEGILSEINTKLIILKDCQNKNAFLKSFIEVTRYFISDLKTEMKYSIINYIGIALALVFILIAPITMGPILLGIMTALLSIATLFVSYNVKQMQKNYRIEDLEKAKETLENELAKLEARINGHEDRRSKIESELQELENEKNRYLADVKTLEQSRKLALEKYVPTEQLNKAFDETEPKDIIRRVRERKEGKE